MSTSREHRYEKNVNVNYGQCCVIVIDTMQDQIGQENGWQWKRGCLEALFRMFSQQVHVWFEQYITYPLYLQTWYPEELKNINDLCIFFYIFVRAHSDCRLVASYMQPPHGSGCTPSVGTDTIASVKVWHVSRSRCTDPSTKPLCSDPCSCSCVELWRVCRVSVPLLRVLLLAVCTQLQGGCTRFF